MGQESCGAAPVDHRLGGAATRPHPAGEPAGARARESALNTADVTPVLVAEGESFFHIPTLAEFFPDPILFAGTPFEFNRVQLVRLIVLTVVLIGMCVIASRAKLVPGRIQSLVEMLVGFVKSSIIDNTLGEREGRKYVPMLVTMFIAIFSLNLAGVVPGLNLAGTSVVGVPLLMALWTFCVYVWFGIKKHGFGGYLRHETMPKGVPAILYILLVPIELLQILVVRWASLTIRLLVNMVSGHMMIVVFIGMTQALLLSGSWLMAISPFAGAMAIAIYGFEIFVAGLQAFIFTMLSAVYIQMATGEDH